MTADDTAGRYRRDLALSGVVALMRTIGIGNLRRPTLRLALPPTWPEIEAAASQRRECR